MNTLLIAFAVLMVGSPFPAVYAYVRLALRSHQPEARQAVSERVRPALVLFGAVWTLVVAAFVAWFVLDWNAIASGARSNLPWMGALCAFHLLWWPFGMPVLRKLETRTDANSGSDGDTADRPVRVASLRPRRVTEYLNRGQRLLPPMLAILAPLVLIGRGRVQPPLEARFLWGACVFGAAGISFLIAYAVWIRFEVRASYGPLGPSEAGEEVERAAEGLRRFRVQSIFWIEMLGAVAFFAGAALFLEVGCGTIKESTAGLIGGIGGAVVGCAGGLFGGLAGLRGYRLNALRSQQRGPG